MTAASTGGDRSARGVVRFSLLDHRTPLGKVIDVALLALNPVFVGLFVAETSAVSPATDALLWELEVAIALVFLVEYGLRLYGARNRVAEFFNGYTTVDLWRYCRRSRCSRCRSRRSG